MMDGEKKCGRKNKPRRKNKEHLYHSQNSDEHETGNQQDHCSFSLFDQDRSLIIERNEITMRVTTRSSSVQRASGNISIMVPLTLFLVLCTDLFFVSSAFLSESKKQCLHLPSVAITREQQCRNPFHVISSNLGASSDGTPESMAQPLPTSNDFMTPEEVVTTCMRYLQGRGDPTPMQERAGLEICYNFSSDSCRMANGGSLESFLQRANNPVFQTMVGCAQWEVVNVGPEIAGTPTRGAMQTVLIDVMPRLVMDGGAERNDRKFLWTIVKERRPPRQGHCLVHECVAVENAFAHTL